MGLRPGWLWGGRAVVSSRRICEDILKAELIEFADRLDVGLERKRVKGDT